MLKRITSMYKTDFHMYFKNLIVRSSKKFQVSHQSYGNLTLKLKTTHLIKSLEISSYFSQSESELA